MSDTPQIHSIVAVGMDNEIGRNNELLWRIPWDMRNFRAVTTNTTVVMGRRTAESIGRALPNRINLVLTNGECDIPGIQVVRTVEEALEVAQRAMTPLMCIGGAQLYDALIPRSSVLHLTRVEETYPDADVRIKPIYMHEWKMTEQYIDEVSPGGLGFTYKRLERF